MKKKIVLACVFTIFMMLMIPITPAFEQPHRLREQLPKKTMNDKSAKPSDTIDYIPQSEDIESEHTDFFALIVGCSRYENKYMNIPKPPFNPIPDWKLTLLLHPLINSKNWDEENIILLLNENATRTNIISAFNEMSQKVKQTDVFLFSWSGHGSKIYDKDGDETQFHTDDLYDEVICPYNTKKDNDSLINIISDDELDYYFSKINAKGMCLIFDCCLSGGLDDHIDNTTKKILHTDKIKENFCEDLSHDISSQCKQNTDENKNNRIVMMSTQPNNSGRVSLLTGFMLTNSIALALSIPVSDRNNDGFISAEEAFNIAKPLFQFQSGLYWCGLWIYSYFYYKYGLLNIRKYLPIVRHIYNGPISKGMIKLTENFPGIFATINTLYSYFFLKEYMKEITRFTIENNAFMKDYYVGDLNLVNLNE